MKQFYLFLLFVLFVFSNNSSLAKEPTVAEFVDLKRYSGEWYEIAKFTNWYERSCAGTKAIYIPINEYSIRVINNCQIKDNPSKIQKVIGVARVVDKETNAKLKIRFMNFPANLFEGDYWIVYVDQSYQNALVGTPDRKNLWVLSRSESLSKEAFDALIQKAKSQGFTTEKLIKTPSWKIVSDQKVARKNP
jgi:apolipoprotein D and lipocalin family protein